MPSPSDSLSFLWVDQQPVPLDQALKYLQSSGKLDDFVSTILRQYILEQELTSRDDLIISPASVEQIATDFRLQNQLTDSNEFEQWLESQSMDRELFRQQITYNLQLEQLKTKIAQPKLQEQFIERKLYLDQVVLSRIVVEDFDLAEELRQQIIEGAKFEALAQDYSKTEDSIFNGMMGLISRGALPDDIRAAIDSAEVGGLVGPLQLGEGWALFRVEKVLSATLDNPQIQQILRDELLEEWIGEKLQRLNIEMQLDNPT